MPLTIRDIKRDLIKWTILEDTYESYEKNIPEDQKLWNCTINDYLVQIWINMKLEIDKCKPKDLLPLIPEDQKWFKKMLIKMIVGRKVFDFSPVVNALASCSSVSKEEQDYLFEFYPTGTRSHLKSKLNIQGLCKV